MNEENTVAESVLASPYPGIREDRDGMKITIVVPKADIYALRIVNMNKGLLYYAIQHFVKFLATECRQRGWTLSNSDDLTNLIKFSTRPSDTHVEGHGVDVGRGVERVRQDDPSTENKRPTRQRKQAAPSSEGRSE